MILTAVLILVAFAGGFYAGVKNANSSKVALGKAIVDKLNK